MATTGSCVSADFTKTQEQQSAAAAHVVVCAFPAHGHIIPTINFSKLLASNGCIVTYVCAQHRMTELKRRVNLATTEIYSNIRLVALPDKIPLGKYSIVDEGVESMYMGWLLDNVSNMQDDFQLLMEELMTSSTSELKSPVCIISDFCLPWTQDVANQFSIPRYVFFPSPATDLCIFMYLPVLISQGVLPVKTHHHQSSGQAGRTIMIPGLPPFSGQIVPNSLRDTCPKFWQEYIIRSSFKAHESAGILINTYCGLEKNAIDALQSEAVNPEKVPIYLVGPLLPSEFFHEDGLQSMKALSTHSEEERICVEWLDKKPPSSVLYVSFGSIPVFLSEAQIHELAFGLEASGQHFLWVLHPESSLSDASANSLLPQGFQSRTNNQGLILCRWAPQLLILSHPSVGGFLTHCGWNSTLESVCRGIPMLAFPLFAEQHLNCHLVVEQLRLGVEIRRGASGIAERVEIERSVRVLMNSEEGVLLRKRAREAREGARQALAMAPTYFQMFVQSFLRAI